MTKMATALPVNSNTVAYRSLSVPCNSGTRGTSVWFFVLLQTKANRVLSNVMYRCVFDIVTHSFIIPLIYRRKAVPHTFQ